MKGEEPQTHIRMPRCSDGIQFPKETRFGYIPNYTATPIRPSQQHRNSQPVYTEEKPYANFQNINSKLLPRRQPILSQQNPNTNQYYKDTGNFDAEQYTANSNPSLRNLYSRFDSHNFNPNQPSLRAFNHKQNNHNPNPFRTSLYPSSNSFKTRPHTKHNDNEYFYSNPHSSVDSMVDSSQPFQMRPGGLAQHQSFYKQPLFRPFNSNRNQK